MSGLREGDVRSAGDDAIIRVRVRRANLSTLEAGVVLGVDALTLGEIELRLVPRDDGIHDLEVVTNALSAAATPDPVDVEVVGPRGTTT